MTQNAKVEATSDTIVEEEDNSTAEADPVVVFDPWIGGGSQKIEIDGVEYLSLEASISEIDKFGLLIIEFNQEFRNQDFQNINASMLDVVLDMYPDNPHLEMLNFTWKCLSFGERQV